ncbi:peroxidasin-like [Oscarella lobularis]|uniref:peroxidasin-like n=1 Tax=Oscarella lobularis TaxID=121494 RepID=UPI0033141D20
MMRCIYAQFVCLLGSVVSSSTGSDPYTIGVRLSSKDVKLSGSATFDCILTGAPKPVVSKWTIGPTTPVPSGFRYVYNTAKTRLNILSVTMEDQGDYYCHATTADGTNISAHAYLPVIDRFTILPQSDTVREGEDAILRCPVDKPTGVTIYWYFNSLPIVSSNSNYSIGGTYREELRVPKANRARNGKYECYAQNSQWSFKAHTNLKVIVEYPTSVVSHVAAETVIVGGDGSRELIVIIAGSVGGLVLLCAIFIVILVLKRWKA